MPPSQHLHPEFAFDRSGNQAGLAGAWLVPDDFEASTEYALFGADFATKHPTKSGRLTERLRKTKNRAWIKWLTARFERVNITGEA